MRKLIRFLWVAILCSGSCVSARQGGISGTGAGRITIYLPVVVDKTVAESARDMAYWLEKAGAGRVTVVSNDNPPANGIRLMDLKKVDLPNVQRAEMEKSAQVFHLSASSVDDIRIVGTGKNSFVNGIYTVLDRLGFRWYMPGDNWVKLGDIRRKLQVNQLIRPEFQDRVYTGSGGASAIPGLDDRDSFSVDFITWNRRNRWSLDYQMKGHSGMAFYRENKNELDRHPEYFCGNRISGNPRLNFDNDQVVKLLVDWSMKQYKPTDPFPVIGVDPADGSGGEGDCLPATIPAISTWSDKYYWLANKVANRLPSGDSKTRVMLYAYNQYAAPPSFDLAPNVYPVIIPYAFQNVADPQQFIALWAKKMKGRKMGIYDYWNITQWAQSLPKFNIYEIPERLRLWKRSGINSINLESTFSKGPMGHSYWLTSQLMWNVDLNFDQLFNEFLQDCFQDAAEDIKRMYIRWSRNYQGLAEPVLSSRDLAQAEKKTRNPQVLARINELKAYVKYIRLYEEYLISRTAAGYENLIRYILSIHHLRLLHTSALVTLYVPKPVNYSGTLDKNQVLERNRQIRPLTATEINRQFEADRKKDPEAYVISDFKFDLTRLRSALGTAPSVIPLRINGINKYQFFVPSKSRLNFKVGSSKETAFIIRDSLQQIVVSKTIKATSSGLDALSVELNKGVYELQWGDTRRSSRIEFPREIVFLSHDRNYDNATYPLLYVYVPADLPEILYFDQYGPGTNDKGFWRDPEGKRVDATRWKGNVYRIAVPAASRGRVWTFVVGHRVHELLNLPSFYSLQPFTYQQ